MTLGDLARAEQVRPPSMTRVVQDLEARGLVARDPDREDKRVTRIRATAKGRRLMTTGRSRRIHAIVEMLDGAGHDDLRAIEHAIDLLEPIVKR